MMFCSERARALCSDRESMEAFYAQPEVKDFIARVRSMAAASTRPGGRRAITGAELGIPDVVLDLVRDNLGEKINALLEDPHMQKALRDLAQATKEV